jgi:hypothetical protein
VSSWPCRGWVSTSQSVAFCRALPELPDGRRTMRTAVPRVELELSLARHVEVVTKAPRYCDTSRSQRQHRADYFSACINNSSSS